MLHITDICPITLKIRGQAGYIHCWFATQCLAPTSDTDKVAHQAGRGLQSPSFQLGLKLGSIQHLQSRRTESGTDVINVITCAYRICDKAAACAIAQKKPWVLSVTCMGGAHCSLHAWRLDSPKGCTLLHPSFFSSTTKDKHNVSSPYTEACALSFVRS